MTTMRLERISRTYVELRTGGAGLRVVVVVIDETVRGGGRERRLLVEHVDDRSEDLPILEALVRRGEVERREGVDVATGLVFLPDPQAIVGNRQALVGNFVVAAHVAHGTGHVPRAVLPAE